MKQKNYSGTTGNDFLQTIPKSLVHKEHIENVYITYVIAISKNNFECGAITPLINAFFSQYDEVTNRNVVLITEICRQAAIAISHIYSDIDFETCFVMDQLNFNLLDTKINIYNENEITMKIKKEVLDFSSLGKPKAFNLVFEIYLNEKMYAKVTGKLSLYSKSIYEKLRKLTRYKITGSQSAFPLKPERIKKLPISLYTHLVDNVNFLKENHTSKGLLVIDRRHLFFFDHINDHIPGMLILAGLQQLLYEYIKKYYPNLKHYEVSSCELQYIFFGELDYPVNLESVEIDVNSSAEIKYFKMKASQNGRILTKAKMSITSNIINK